MIVACWSCQDPDKILGKILPRIFARGSTVKPLIARFDNVSFGGASIKDHVWFKKSITALKCYLINKNEIRIMNLK